MTFTEFWDGLKYGERTAMADRLDRHVMYLEAVAHRRKRPSFALAQAIADDTGQQVTLDSWGDILQWVGK